MLGQVTLHLKICAILQPGGVQNSEYLVNFVLEIAEFLIRMISHMIQEFFWGGGAQHPERTYQTTKRTNNLQAVMQNTNTINVTAT